MELSHKRIRYLLGMETSTDPELLRDIDQFGFGTERSLEAFQAYSGIRFKERQFSGPAVTGDFPPHPRSA